MGIARKNSHFRIKLELFRYFALGFKDIKKSIQQKEKKYEKYLERNGERRR